ncbi:phosphoribosyltransferase family protein [Flavitalea sp. BT771]|uniref:phosphoribosyltransferase n=1 Tax=Flavitalea sp. BT771 TaxID=3063329 RepID=UPI0026E2F26C|nr:phosphoribosyltransferase family protein [Flavitalea sp. BT771]MDO6430346.1 phosphoribosyltransferase family protein [Flavitalea sp. BT771]MDV6219514.1 phosphoribosyltransferase family protein [Flavitalea sp. BT771]
MFTDRIQAGKLLAEKLRKYQDKEGVILAVPRGGVPIAYAVAKELGMPLDLVLTKKIGHPTNREFAIGAVSLTDSFVIPYPGVSQFYIDREIKTIRERLKEMYRKFMGNKEPEVLTDKTVIVIDDGIATGNTLMGTISMLRKDNPAKIVIAVPVASQSAVRKLSRAVDELITVLIPEEFYGVGAFYENFEQVSDEEVMYYLDKWKRDIKKAG